jgi:hypothetical protein
MRRVKSLPGYLVTPEKSRANRLPALCRNIFGLLAIEFENMIKVEEIGLELVDVTSKVNDAPSDSRAFLTKT